MAAYGDRDSQRVLPIAPIRNQFSGEQPTSYMSLQPRIDVCRPGIGVVSEGCPPLGGRKVRVNAVA